MTSYLVTGTARGIGLELVNQLCELPASEVGIIFATSRSESPALKALAQRSSGKVFFVQLDTTDEVSIKYAVEKVSEKLNGKGLDVLVNNAGIMVGDFSQNAEHM
jgi:NAD(P)-dependent dehydrogenase (short-subunit alcohol dehydrogenase family)